MVTTLVAGEAARGSMEEEVAKSVANAIAGGNAANGGAAEGRHAPGTAAAVPAARGRSAAAEQVKAQPAVAAKATPRGNHGQGDGQHVTTPARTATVQHAEHDGQPETDSQPGA